MKEDTKRKYIQQNIFQNFKEKTFFFETFSLILGQLATCYIDEDERFFPDVYQCTTTSTPRACLGWHQIPITGGLEEACG